MAAALKKMGKPVVAGTEIDQADGQFLMSRRAYCNKTQLCLGKGPAAEPCPVVCPNPERPRQAESKREERSASPSSEESSMSEAPPSKAELEAQAMPPVTITEAATKTAPEACGAHLRDGVVYYTQGTGLYPGLQPVFAYPQGAAPKQQQQFIAIAPMPQQQQQQQQIAMIPAPRALKRPEECKFMKATRRMMFSFQFTMEESIRVSATLTSALTSQAQKRLVDGQDIMGADPTRAEIPRYVVPTSVSLVSTTSEAPVPFVAVAPWIVQQSLVLDNGQIGTFVVPPGSRSYSDPEATLYLMSKDKEFAEICKYKYLIDKQVGVLRSQAVPTDNNVNFTINPGTDLFAVLKAFDAERLGSEGNCTVTYPAQMFNETMQRLDETIKMVNRYVQTIDNIKVKLEVVRPPNVKPDVTADALLDVVLGGVAVESTEAKQYYLKKGNRVSVCLDVAYLLLV